ncbi:MAG: SpoIIE family protein phosphatase [Lentisphaeria bacterium]
MPGTLGDAMDERTIVVPAQARQEYQRVGPYTVLGRIGAGGMGAVFRARGADGREVALKVMNPELTANADLVRRFQREYEISAALDHPNIARVLDCGQDHDRGIYIAMELVEGRSAKALCQSGGADLVTTCDIIEQAAAGLAYAHAHNVVHRDIKPENLLVRPDGVVKIIDFGIARLDQPETVTLTLTNAVMGSPLYMSPEQRDNPKAVDHRADIYALGVTFYQLLSGRLPSGLISLELIPAGLRRILETSMAYEAGRRYASVQEMLDDLRRYRAGASLAADRHALDEVTDNTRLREQLIESLFPREVPVLPGFDLARLFLPADGVGGNYHDFVSAGPGRLGVLVGNVSNRPGVRSALFLAMIRAAFRLSAEDGEADPAAVLARINRFIAREGFDEFALVTYAVLESVGRRVHLASAGYRPALWWHAASQSFSQVAAAGMGLGIDADASFSREELALASGDFLVFATAGIPKLQNMAGEAYGAARLEAVLRDHAAAGAAELVEAVRRDLRHFAAGVAQNDDLTLIAIRAPG